MKKKSVKSLIDKYVKAKIHSRQGHKKKLSRKMKSRVKLLEKQKGKCYWCKKTFNTKTKQGRAELTLDHLLPRSKGGTWSVANLVLACEQCNAKRGNKMTNPITKEKIDLSRLIAHEPTTIT